MNVKKRNGSIVPFQREFISRAIGLAAAAAGEHSDEAVERTTKAIEEKLCAMAKDVVEIETIQDTVEECLFEQQRFRTAKAYILYRIEKEKERSREDWSEGLLSREFLSQIGRAHV